MSLGSKFGQAKKGLKSASKAAIAAAAGTGMFIANAGKMAKSRMDDIGSFVDKARKPGEVVVMKKSTWAVLLVALAAVAGVLGALYIYVLRREKELDEYEQLLFSEDFNDELPDDYADEPAEDAEAAKA